MVTIKKIIVNLCVHKLNCVTIRIAQQMISCVDPYRTKTGCVVQAGCCLLSTEDTWTAEASIELIVRYLAVEGRK